MSIPLRAGRADHGVYVQTYSLVEKPMRRFNPLALGRLECATWVAYYRRRWGWFLWSAIGMVRASFRMSWPRTVYGALLVLRANQLWAPVPDNDPDGARRAMRRFYRLLARTYGEPFDPIEAARREVEWWRIHRYLQRDAPEEDTGPLVDALAALYAHVYQVPAARVRLAATERAEAMRISDRWVADGCDPANPALATERAALVRSYAALLAAVHHSAAPAPQKRAAAARSARRGRRSTTLPDGRAGG